MTFVASNPSVRMASFSVSGLTNTIVGRPRICRQDIHSHSVMRRNLIISKFNVQNVMSKKLISQPKAWFIINSKNVEVINRTETISCSQSRMTKKRRKRCRVKPPFDWQAHALRPYQSSETEPCHHILLLTAKSITSVSIIHHLLLIINSLQSWHL